MSSTTMCQFFMRGTCRFGNRCWNSHDLGSTSSFRPLSPFRYSTTDDDDEIVSRRESTSNQTNSPASTASKSRQSHQVSAESSQKPQKSKSQPQPTWILTNKSSGETREGTPDNMLVETVKKLNEADNLVKTLREQLRNVNNGEHFSWMEHQMEQCIENDLQCNICYEMFIKPTVLNCSHTFCHECIESWTRRVNHCPTCRVYVKSKSYCLTLDTFLDKMADSLPDETKTRREALKVERNNSRVETSRNRRNGRRRNNRTTMRQTLGVLWGERDRDGAEWNISLDETLFDPIRLGDVLGRNRNDRDDWEDNLSDSSLDRYYFLG